MEWNNEALWLERRIASLLLHPDDAREPDYLIDDKNNKVVATIAKSSRAAPNKPEKKKSKRT
jgi:hypothetical protein